MSIGAADILSVTKAVTKDWTKQRKAEERGSRSRSSRMDAFSGRVHFTEIADAILPDAYQRASGNGMYTASKRQVFYACRELFRIDSGRPLEWPYFSNTRLVQYMNPPRL